MDTATQAVEPWPQMSPTGASTVAKLLATKHRLSLHTHTPTGQGKARLHHKTRFYLWAFNLAAGEDQVSQHGGQFGKEAGALGDGGGEEGAMRIGRLPE